MFRKVFLAVCILGISLFGKMLQMRESFMPGEKAGTSADGATFGRDVQLVQEEGRAVAVLRGGGRIDRRPADFFQDAGTISFRFRMDHDTSANNERIKSKLRNQILFKTIRNDKMYAICYTTNNAGATGLHFGVFTSSHKAQYLLNSKLQMQQGRWYEVKINYGDSVSLYVDGRKQDEATVSGIFGHVVPSPAWLFFGTQDRNNFENEFSIADFELNSSTYIRQRLSIPYVKQVQLTLDGALNEPFWGECVSISGFSSFGSCCLAPEQPSFRIGYTENGICIGAVIPAKEGTAVAAVQTMRDSAVYTDDAMEFRLQPKEDGAVYTFLANALGTQFDAIRRPKARTEDMTYNPDWQVAAKITDAGWIAEVFVPYKALQLDGPPKPGELWRGNFFIDRNSSTGGGMTHTATKASFPDPSGFSQLLFTGADHALGIESVSGYKEAQPQIALRQIGPRAPVVSLTGSLCNSQGFEVSNYKFRLNDTNDTVYGTAPLEAGQYSMIIRGVDAEGTELLYQRIFFKSDLKASIILENYPYLGQASLNVNVPAALHNNAAASITAQIKGAGAPKSSFRQPLTKGKCQLMLPTKELKEGKYSVVVQILDQGGRLLESNERELIIYPKPKWFDNQLGIDHKVPVPWTSVKRSAKSLSVWGREYIFNGTAFPKQIINQKRAMLSAEATFSLKMAEAASLNLAVLPAKLVADTGDEVIYRAETLLGKTKVRLTGKLEFDGCYRCDLELLPPKEGASIQELVLSIPMLKEWAVAYVAGSGSSQSVFDFDKDAERRFTPYTWLGNDHGGLAAFFESEEFWTLDNRRAMTLKRDSAGNASWSYNIVISPRKIAGPVCYTFGLMASPVRPLTLKGPFAMKSYNSGYASFQRGEFVHYMRPAVSASCGSVDFIFRRLPASGKSRAELLYLSAPKCAYYRLFIDANSIALYDNNTKLQSASFGENYKKADYNAIAFNWNGKEIAVILNGTKLFAISQNKAFSELVASISKDGQIGIGSFHEYQAMCDIIADEVRISTCERDGKMPQAPRTKDADTLVLDHLDETFAPDGFSTLTAAGGESSVCSKFVKGCFGNGLQLLTEPQRNKEEVLKNDMRANFGFAWKWHNDNYSPSGEYQWPPNFFIPYRKVLTDDVQAAHRRNAKLLPYAIYPAIHSPGPLNDQFGFEWCIKPVNLAPYAPPEGHHMLSVSLAAKGWVDYLVAGIQDLFDTYHFDGIYTDGGTIILESSNAAYGCGWTDEKGNRRTTYPFFAVREGVKRFYKVAKADTNRLVVNHLSFTLPIMTAGFGDVLYTGEHEDYTNMQTARFRFSSEPWGVYITLNGASSHSWSSLHTMTGLLVNSPLKGTGVTGRDDWARKDLRIRAAYESFGYKDASFMPFYQTEKELLEPLPEKVEAAAYVKGDGTLMLIVANYNKSAMDVPVTLKAAAKGLKAKSLLSNASYHVKGNTVIVPVLGENFQIVYLGR